MHGKTGYGLWEDTGIILFNILTPKAYMDMFIPPAYSEEEEAYTHRRHSLRSQVIFGPHPKETKVYWKRVIERDDNFTK